MNDFRSLVADRGLTLTLAAAPHWRISWGTPDWLGPIGIAALHGATEYVGGSPVLPAGQPNGSKTRGLDPVFEAFDGSDDLGPYQGFVMTWRQLPWPLRTTARAYRDAALLVLGIEATAAAADLATGVFARPSIVWPYCVPAHRSPDGIPSETRTCGYQYTEFALPVSGDAACTGFFLAPHRPAIVEPLLFIAPDGRTLMLAPLNQFHEQIITVPADRDQAADGVRCGWHGDLASVPAGFSTELAVWAGDGPRQLLVELAAVLRRRHGTQRRSRYADDGVAKLSYWTDNGAYYYYRTEPGRDYATTLGHAVADLHERAIPVRAAQIDSWFYPHQNLRPVSAEGAPIVPPSGMLTWEPRADLFPGGFTNLASQVDGLPLTFHSRHFSSQSPYFAQQPESAWVDGEYAHPADPALFGRLMEQAAGWGAITYEQDWMVESFLGVRGLRAQPGRARAWQESLDRAAGERGLTLQWCMSTPADFLQTTTLRNLTSIRTSGDYRYLFDNGLNWVWFLHTNALARALGLNVFKDTFISNPDDTIGYAEPYAEAEALLASLSTGPVAIGDQIGCANREIVLRTCREDGILVKPDVPLAAIDRCFYSHAYFESAPLIGETFSAHPAGRWSYVASFNACHTKQPINCRVALADLGAVRPDGPVIMYDWRARRWTRLEPDGGWECTLGFQEWDYRVLCPLLSDSLTVFGDVSKYVTVGDRRIAQIVGTADGVSFTVLGVPRSLVEVHGFSATRPHGATAAVPGSRRSLPEGAAGDDSESWTWDAQTGRWMVRVWLGALPHVQLAITSR